MLFVAPAVAEILKAPEAAFDGTVAYVYVCAAGAVFIVAFNLLGSIFRGLGNSKLPLLSVCIACVFNIAGDLLLVVPSAGVGVAGRLSAFIMLVPSAYMQSMSAFVAQNIGAGKEKRARETLWCGILSSVAVGVVMFWAAFFDGDALSVVFVEDPAVVAASAEYLKSYAIDCLLTSFLFCFFGIF